MITMQDLETVRSSVAHLQTSIDKLRGKKSSVMERLARHGGTTMEKAEIVELRLKRKCEGFQRQLDEVVEEIEREMPDEEE